MDWFLYDRDLRRERVNSYLLIWIFFFHPNKGKKKNSILDTVYTENAINPSMIGSHTSILAKKIEKYEWRWQKLMLYHVPWTKKVTWTSCIRLKYVLNIYIEYIEHLLNVLYTFKLRFSSRGVAAARFEMIISG